MRELPKTVQDAARMLQTLQSQNKVSVTLTIYSKELRLDEISKLLDLKPSHTLPAGSLLGSCEKGILLNFSTWSRTSADIVKTNLFEDHLKWMLSGLHGKRTVLDYLRREQSCETKLSCNIRSWSRLQHLMLHPDQLLTLSRLGLPLEISCIYDNTDQEY